MKICFKPSALSVVLLAASHLALAATAAKGADTSAADTETFQIIQVPGTPPADNASGARIINPGPSACTLSPISPSTGPAGTFVANVCVTVGGVGKLTGTGAAKYVIFNNLASGSRPHTFTALNRTAKTSAVNIPVGSVGSSCGAAKFNSAGGLNYITNVVVGWSTFPGVQYCPQ